MIRKVILIIFLLFPILFLSSCSDDKYVEIHTLIESNTNEPIRCYGVHGAPPEGLVIRGGYESTFKRERGIYDIGFELFCDDPNTLITATIWLDGKKKLHRMANCHMNVSVDVR